MHSSPVNRALFREISHPPEDRTIDSLVDLVVSFFDESRVAEGKKPVFNTLADHHRAVHRRPKVHSELMSELGPVAFALTLVSLRQIAAMIIDRDGPSHESIKFMVIAALSSAYRAQSDLKQRTRAEAESDARQDHLIYESTRQEIRDQVESNFRQDFLGTDKWFEESGHGALMPRATYLRWKAEFVQRWAARNFPDIPLDSEQAIAVASTTGDVHVQARAGSGKTRVMVLRAIFLQLHCGVSPQEIMLVAFNNKVMEEIQSRLTDLLPEGTKLPLVLTFHALSLAIADPRVRIVVDNGVDDRNRAEKVRQVRKDIERERPDDVRRAMLKFYEEGGGDDAAIESRRRTFSGDYVKSPGELKIANALFSLGVAYKYERQYEGVDYRYLPDFTVLNGNNRPSAVIEYFGMVGDPDYDLNTVEKRDLWESKPEPFIEIMPSDVRGHDYVGVAAWLEPKFRELGIATCPKTCDQIWAFVQEHALTSFDTSISDFIGLARNQRLNPHDLESLRRNHRFLSVAEELFVDLASDAYGRYLATEEFDDFDGVFERASAKLSQGKTEFKRHTANQEGDVAQLRFLHIDELQDLSPLFTHLVAAIRQQANDLSVFGVGDDWQLINGFAGSDLAHFVAFHNAVRPESRLSISTNYRSSDPIVEFGNQIMAGLGSGANTSRRPGISPAVAQSGRFSLTDKQCVTQSQNEESFHALINYVLQTHGGDIAVVARRERVWSSGVKAVTLSTLEEATVKRLSKGSGRIGFSTVHKFKGREARSVILLAGDKHFPFVHHAWFLNRILGEQLDKIHAEEQRLFYVGATRAMNNLYLFVPAGQAVCRWGSQAQEFDWTGIPSAGDTANEIAISVWPNHHMAARLRELQFTPDPNTNRWIRRGPRHDLDFEEFDSAIGDSAEGVEIRDNSGTLIYSRGERPAQLLPVQSNESLPDEWYF